MRNAGSPAPIYFTYLLQAYIFSPVKGHLTIYCIDLRPDSRIADASFMSTAVSL